MMTAAPNNHLPIQIQQKKLEKKMWNRLKFNNKDTRTFNYIRQTLHMTSFWCPYW